MEPQFVDLFSFLFFSFWAVLLKNHQKNPADDDTKASAKGCVEKGGLF